MSTSYRQLQHASLEKLPPFDVDAEQAVLGAIMLDPSVLPDVQTILTPRDFFRSGHGQIFEACRRLARQGLNSIDLISLRDALADDRVLTDVGGAAYLAALVDLTPTAANYAYHAGIVRQKSILRQLLNQSVDLAAKIYNEAPKLDAKTLLSEYKDVVEGLFRQSFIGPDQQTFWTQDATGIARSIEPDKFLHFMFETYGYAQLETNETVLFVQKIRNVVKNTVWVKSTNKTMKDTLKAYCRQAQRNDVWRVLLDTNKLFSYGMLTGLDTLENDFYRDTADTCTLFFQNGALRIQTTNVEFLPFDQIDKYVWDDQIAQHEYAGKYHRDWETVLRADLRQAMQARDTRRVRALRLILADVQTNRHAAPDARIEFSDLLHRRLAACEHLLECFQRGQRQDLYNQEAYEMDVIGEYEVRTQDRKSEYQQFLEYVSSESIEEYTGKVHHVDNLHVFEFAIAHALHAYNNPANMRAVILADSNPSFVSNGRRGKKVILDGLKHVRGSGVVVKEDGKAFDSGRFKFQSIKPNTKILILDDVSEDFDFKLFYSAITDGFVVEGKGFARFAFSFEDNPKLIVTTNHPPYGDDLSSADRVILLPVSDYFVRIGRTPRQVFGHMLYDDWDTDEWNRFFDYIVSLIQRYLRRPDPSVVPIADLTIFNANKLLLKVPEAMVDYLDNLVKEKDYEFDQVMRDIEGQGVKFRTTHEYSKALYTYCRLRGYKVKANMKDGRYISHGVRFLCLQHTTPELPGLKYEKPGP